VNVKEAMEAELNDYVLNPEIPDTHNDHRKVYQDAHPGEVLTQEDVIHHINGNHNDNRPENLMRTTDKKHAGLHALMRKAK